MHWYGWTRIAASALLLVASAAWSGDEVPLGYSDGGCGNILNAGESVSNVVMGAASTGTASVSVNFGGWGVPQTTTSGGTDVRLRWGTDSVEYGNLETAQLDVAENTRIDFDLTGLTTGTEYFYRVECRMPPADSGGDARSNWMPRPPGRWRHGRAPGEAFTFIHFSDTHASQAFRSSDCGAGVTATDSHLQVVHALRAMSAEDGIDFAIGTGDDAQTRSSGANECTSFNGMDFGLNAVGSDASHGQDTADSRWYALTGQQQHFPPFMRRLGAFWYAKGNHEGEAAFDSTCSLGGCSTPTLCDGGPNDQEACQFDNECTPATCEPDPCVDDSCDSIGPPLQAENRASTGHYFVSGPGGVSQMSLSMAARKKALKPWTIGSGNADGHWYYGPWGDAMFMVLDVFSQYDTTATTFGHPTVAGDWELGATQIADFDAALAACVDPCRFVFAGIHHIVGGLDTGAQYHYGRNGLNGNALVTDDIEADFRGQQALLQSKAKAWVDLAAGRVVVFLMGHDHLGLQCEKYDVGGATGVWYSSSSQPGGNIGGPVWRTNGVFEHGWDCNDSGTPQYNEPVLDPRRPGTLERGYTRFTVNADDTITMQQISATPGSQWDGLVRYSLTWPDATAQTPPFISINRLDIDASTDERSVAVGETFVITNTGEQELNTIACVAAVDVQCDSSDWLGVLGVAATLGAQESDSAIVSFPDSDKCDWLDSPLDGTVTCTSNATNGTQIINVSLSIDQTEQTVTFSPTEINLSLAADFPSPPTDVTPVTVTLTNDDTLYPFTFTLQDPIFMCDGGTSDVVQIDCNTKTLATSGQAECEVSFSGMSSECDGDDDGSTACILFDSVDATSECFNVNIVP